MLSPQHNVQRTSSDLGSARSGHSKNRGRPSTHQPATSRNSQNIPYAGPLISIPVRPRENSQVSSSSPRGSIAIITRDDIIDIKWPEKPMDRAPELNLFSKRPCAFHVHSGDCFSKLFHLIASVCKTFNRVGDSSLANFKPVVGRTDHTLEYVNDLAREYTINLKYGSQTNITTVLIRTPSGTTIKSDHSGKVAKTLSTNSAKRAQEAAKTQLLKEFYEKSYRTLSILQQCIGHFKNIIFNLTFTRYAEEELTDSETKMIRGKSIIGSCIWVVTLALQQLQEDPDVEQGEYLSKTNSDLLELGIEMQSIISLSLATWHETILAIVALERVHKKTEEVFHKQTHHFHKTAKPESEPANVAALHMRQYRRSHGDLDELRNFKGFDPYASLLTWTNKRQGPARILYLTDYSDPESLWCGFDILTMEKKVAYLKEILNFIRLVLESVRESVQKIQIDLQGVFQDTLVAGIRRQNSPRAQPHHFTGIASYEDGIDAMDEILSKKLDGFDWNSEETYEFFETDKIFLDDMDLLALGAAVTRGILFEARHTMHICYETWRLLDYREFANLPTYGRIYQRVKEGFVEERPPRNPLRTALAKKGKKTSISSSNQFDTEEAHLELRNVAGLFRTSHYREILKNLPLYTNRLGITLQDAEMVFTPSSEKLLS